jgi:hypothetical protein
MLKMKGSSSLTPKGGGQMGPGEGGEGGVSFTFLLGREKIGGESLWVAEAGNTIIKGDDGGKRPRRNCRITSAKTSAKNILTQHLKADT